MTLQELTSFYQGKRVLVTGHTGFKGTWMCRILALCGAKVTGYALNPPTDPSIYQIIGLEETMDSRIGDIRDLEKLRPVFEEVRPEVVFHLAAQPIVRDSYKDPVYTYETNVMGTVNLLECIRLTSSVRSFVNITTDKVYENKEWEYGYRECDIRSPFLETDAAPFRLPEPEMSLAAATLPMTGLFRTAYGQRRQERRLL